MADEIPVCTWPDGRIVSRSSTHRSSIFPDRWVWFTSSPGEGFESDIEFSFELHDSRPYVETLPGFLQSYPTAQFSTSTALACSGKLLWFAREVGLVDPTMLPISLFHGHSVHDIRFPKILPDSHRPLEVASDVLALDQKKIEALVGATLPGLDAWATEASFSNGGAHAKDRNTRFELSGKAVRDLARRDLTVKTYSRRRGDEWWEVISPNHRCEGRTLGEALREVASRSDVLFEDQRANWEAGLEPGQFLWDDSVFRLLGEPSPILWPMDRLAEWVAQTQP